MLRKVMTVVVIAGSLVLSYLILYAAEFKQHTVHVKSLFQHPLVETVTSYAVAILVALALLLLVGMPEARGGSMATLIACTVTLALPASVGAAAGRLIT